MLTVSRLANYLAKKRRRRKTCPYNTGEGFFTSMLWKSSAASFLALSLIQGARHFPPQACWQTCELIAPTRTGSQAEYKGQSHSTVLDSSQMEILRTEEFAIPVFQRNEENMEPENGTPIKSFSRTCFMFLHKKQPLNRQKLNNSGEPHRDPSFLRKEDKKKTTLIITVGSLLLWYFSHMVYVWE